MNCGFDDSPSGRWRFCRARLDPAAVDDVALVGDGAGVVGGEEEHEAGTSSGWMSRLRAWLERISALVFGVYQSCFWRSVTMAPGRTALTRMLCRAELVGEGAGEADDGGLGGDVDGQAGGGDDPGDGAHIDDGAALGCAHGGEDGLDEEEWGRRLTAMERSQNSGVTSSMAWRWSLAALLTRTSMVRGWRGWSTAVWRAAVSVRSQW